MWNGHDKIVLVDLLQLWMQDLVRAARASKTLSFDSEPTVLYRVFHSTSRTVDMSTNTDIWLLNLHVAR